MTESIKLIKVRSKDEIKVFSDLATEIWNEYYPPLLSKKQIDYMVEKFQSPDVIEAQIKNDNYQYYILSDETNYLGYFSFKIYSDHVYLSKFYLKSSSRGKGLFNIMLSFVENEAEKNKVEILRLNVNKDNSKTIEIYKNKGFSIIRAEINPIGNNFIMDDFVMEKKLAFVEKENILDAKF